ncbi:hypothetical protein LWI29_009467 [Acer saccharum]|uniref:Uncharacterized protein n=1 Tax=Acer saccharum TaxID=4024 RepID=A0AA39VSK3_ACESA|nr:hypothetical protein LWI29_009467 [Acer saccharum]
MLGDAKFVDDYTHVQLTGQWSSSSGLLIQVAQYFDSSYLIRGFVYPISLSDLELQPFTGVGSWTVFRIKNGLVVVLLN